MDEVIGVHKYLIFITEKSESVNVKSVMKKTVYFFFSPFFTGRKLPRPA